MAADGSARGARSGRGVVRPPAAAGWALLVALAALVAPGCGGSSVTTPWAPAPTRASPFPSASPAASPTTATCGPRQGGSEQRASVTDVRAEAHPGHDRLIVEFDRAVPRYSLAPNPDGVHFTGSFSGLPITLRGSHGLHLQISNVDTPGHYPHGSDIVTGSSTLAEVRVIGDFEGSLDVAIGMNRDVCPAVAVLDGPPRLAIDLPTGVP